MRTLIICFTAIVISGCGMIGKGKIVNTVHHPDNRVETTTRSGMSSGAMKKVSKYDMAENLCGMQSTLYNEQRKIVEQSPIIIVDGKAIEIPESSKQVIYNHSIPPFDMQSCIAEGLRMPYERLGMKFLGVFEKVATLGLKVGAPAYFAYKAIQSSNKNGGTEINNPQPGSTNVVGGKAQQAPTSVDQSASGVCPGTVDPDTGICVTPVEEAAEEESESEE